MTLFENYDNNFIRVINIFEIVTILFEDYNSNLLECNNI